MLTETAIRSELKCCMLKDLNVFATAESLHFPIRSICDTVYLTFTLVKEVYDIVLRTFTLVKEVCDAVSCTFTFANEASDAVYRTFTFVKELCDAVYTCILFQKRLPNQVEIPVFNNRCTLYELFYFLYGTIQKFATYYLIFNQLQLWKTVINHKMKL